MIQTPTPYTAGAVVRVIQDLAEWEAIEPAWRELFDASPTAAPPLRWEWLKEWWRVYGPVYGDGARNLRLMTVWHGSCLIAALPLYLGVERGSMVRTRALRFLSTGEAEHEETCAEYLDLLHLPGAEGVALDALSEALLGPMGSAWDELRLTSISEHSPLHSWASSLQNPWRPSVSPSGICPIANLSGGLEAYVAQLSQSARKQARRLLRAAEASEIRFEVAAAGPEIDGFFDQLVALHQRRWEAVGAPGCFSSPRFTEFHRSLCRQLVPGGQAVLARLSAGSEPLAILYGFTAGDRFHFYQSGIVVDQDGPLESPGVAANLLLMGHLAERGVTRYDFLKDTSEGTSYKKRLATEQCGLADLHVVRPTVRAATNLALAAVRRTARKVKAVAQRG